MLPITNNSHTKKSTVCFVLITTDQKALTLLRTGTSKLKLVPIIVHHLTAAIVHWAPWQKHRPSATAVNWVWGYSVLGKKDNSPRGWKVT